MESKLPRRIAWFAPWTWKPWQVVVACLLLAFVASIISDVARSMLGSFEIEVYDTYSKVR
jgi:hypothetical protein